MVMALVYYMIHPKIAEYLFLATKDIYYAAFFILFYMLLYMVFFRNKKAETKWYILLALAIAGVIVFRNEGKYIVAATMLSCLLLKDVRGRAGLYLAEILLVLLVIEKVVYPALNVGVSKYAPAEMLSIPFQQTARYVRDAGGEVTKEEREAIDAVLNYDGLAENYDPNISDSVKRTYRGDSDYLKNYFRVWIKMFFKHPEIYIQATMNNYYQYFYWGSKFTMYYSYSYSRFCMENINANLGTDFAYPDSLNILRDELELLREDIFKLPILDLIQTPALYTWTILALMFFCIRERSRKGIVFLVPALTHILVLVSGPTNGYYGRYQVPMVVYLPIAVIILMKIIRSDQDSVCC